MLKSIRRATIGVRSLLFVAFIAALLVVAVGGCSLQSAGANYPSKPIEAVVVYGAGGSNDLITRLLMPYVQKKWGQSINVIDKPGSGGITGTEFVLQATPDGYTVGMFGDLNGYLNNAVLSASEVPYKWDDLNHIAMVAIQPLVLVVKSDSKYNALSDLVADLKKDPASFNYAASGVAGPSVFAISQLADAVGADATKLKKVSFDGGAASAAAVAGGQVTMAAQYVAEVSSLISSGNLKPLAVVLPQRWPGLPNVPTFTELGYPSVVGAGGGPVGVFAQPKLSADIAKKWEDTLAEVVKDQDFQSRLQQLGGQPMYLNGKDFRAYVQKQYEATHAIVQKLGIHS